MDDTEIGVLMLLSTLAIIFTQVKKSGIIIRHITVSFPTEMLTSSFFLSKVICVLVYTDYTVFTDC